MIDQLVPSWAVAEFAFEDADGDPLASLFPEEAARLTRAVAKRRHEFATVRRCARAALGRLGYPPMPLLPGTRGAPHWPKGVVGSMTHCDGYRAAVVAKASDSASLGIDAERRGPLPEGVLETVALPSELRMITELTSLRPDMDWDRLLFSAKESVFKTWYPLTGLELDFDEAELTIDALRGTFTARLLVPGPVIAGRRLGTFNGRWAAGNDLVVTAIALPAVPGAEPGAGGSARVTGAH